MNLMYEMKQNFDDLMSKSIYHGYWETINENKGCLPDARKGATMNMIGSSIYVFGGLSRETYNDIKIFELDHRKWKAVSYEGMKVPEARIHHSMVNFDNNLALFGGGGAYMSKLKMRSSYNDIWVFDTRQLRWIKREGSGIPPKKRMSHAFSIAGSLMMIHGGMNTEAKIVLDDFNLYDLELNHWLKVKVMLNGNVIESDAKYGTGECYDEEL